MTARSEGRVVGVDIARGLAMLGMTTVHVWVGSNEEPSPLGSWLLNAPSGRASVLFFTLSGVALSLVARRGGPSSSTPVLLRRGTLLLVGGWFVMEMIWAGSILHQYGAMFLLAPVLLRRSSRALLAGAAAAFLIGPWLAVLGPWALGPWAAERYGVHGWLVDTLMYALFDEYALVVWVGFFMVGVVLGRLRVSPRQGALMLAGGVVACVALTVPIDRVNESSERDTSADGSASVVEWIDAADVGTCDEYEQWDDQWYDDIGEWNGPVDPELLPDFDPTPCYEAEFDRGPVADVVSWDVVTDLEAHSDTTAWALQAQAIAIAVLGACLMSARIGCRVLWPLAALGSISLSAYIVHMALVQDLWVLGGGDRSDTGVWHQFAILAGIWTIELVMATVIRHWFRRGPFEWLLAQFTGR